MGEFDELETVHNKEKSHFSKVKQARKSSEDAQAAGYAQFEKDWAGYSFWVEKFGPKIL